MACLYKRGSRLCKRGARVDNQTVTPESSSSNVHFFSLKCLNSLYSDWLAVPKLAKMFCSLRCIYVLHHSFRRFLLSPLFVLLTVIHLLYWRCKNPLPSVYQHFRFNDFFLAQVL